MDGSVEGRWGLRRRGCGRPGECSRSTRRVGLICPWRVVEVGTHQMEFRLNQSYASTVTSIESSGRMNITLPEGLPVSDSLGFSFSQSPKDIPS